jgi:hypothetical protein
MSKLAWQQPKRGFSSVYVLVALALLVTGYCYRRHHIPRSLSSPDLQQCAIDNLLGTGLPFMNASPISLADFEERRNRLAQALVAEDVDAFVVEPGYTFKYYGNVSQPDWEVWEVINQTTVLRLQVLMY